MQRTKPPFRADQVGSLLRSAPVKEARTRRATGEITPAGLKAVEDAEIAKLVAKQEAIGLQAVTDGEFRRSWWHYDFLSHLDGVELVSVAQGLQFKGTQTKAEGLHVHSKIDFSPSHPMIGHFKYLKSVAKAVPKMTIPSPTALHYRGGRQAIEKSAYPEMEPFFADLGKEPTPRPCAPSAKRDVPTCSLTKSTWPISATRRSATTCAAAATTRTSCWMSMPTW